MLQLTQDNYYSAAANMDYMSASQLKAFMRCEAGTLARLRGEYPAAAPSKDMLIGSYVDAYFSGELEKFCAEHPEIVSSRGASKGELKADFQYANQIIQRIERDSLMMQYLSGLKQQVMTGEISGVPFKIRMDSYHPGKCIVDLKIMGDFDSQYVRSLKRRVHFIEFWGYDYQLAIYQAIEGHHLPVYIVAATKEKPEPDICIYQIPQERLDVCMDTIRTLAPRYQQLKQGLIAADRCESCPYCRSTKQLKHVVNYQEEDEIYAN